MTVSIQYRNVTDRRTDRRTELLYRYRRESIENGAVSLSLTVKEKDGGKDNEQIMSVHE